VFFRRSLGAVGCGVAAAAFLALHPAQNAGAASSGLAYDEVTRFATSAVAPGTYASGSFDADFQAAAGSSFQQGHGIFGFVKTIRSAVQVMRSGTAASYAYLDNMEREDDPANKTATIAMPDKNQVIHLNLANKTYWIATPQAGTPPMPAEQAPAPGPQQAQKPPQPGTAKMVISVTNTSLGTMSLAGEQADGYQTTFKLEVTQATGSCRNGSFSSTLTEFISRYPEPRLTYPGHPVAMPHGAAEAFTHPEQAALSPGCRPTITARTNHGPTPPTGRLVLWEAISLASGAPQGQGGQAGFVIERGHVRELGDKDRGLFEIPAGFTQVQEP
jgi:hypothetical protein